MTAMKRIGFVLAVSAIGATAACSNGNSTIDEGLKADLAAAGGGSSDLQLASASPKSQVVVSAIEGGPTAAPKRAAPKLIAKPSPKAVTRVAPQRAPAPAPAARAVVEAPAPVDDAPRMEAPAPAPLPSPAPRQDNRVYKTEAEIFRQMPWIKP